ncbi:hypothetical protein [Bosea sp. AAP35]|uniref:hypothetical protein n=1 Tax=Bosea sp. AAP35 TaxID=1523417 RepID=UPI000AC097A5|nr:hypothetical protein [Bosea sp. AAP35]
MSGPITIQTEEERQVAQQRIAALQAEPDSPDKEGELQAIAEALLVFQLRLDETH